MYAFLFCFVCVADLELGLKRDAVGAVDGSSLEALLKGEPLDRRSGVADVRGPEDDPATVEPPVTSTTTTSSGRIRKVRPKADSMLMLFVKNGTNDFLFFFNKQKQLDCYFYGRECWTMMTTWMIWMTKTLRMRPPRGEGRASPRLVFCFFTDGLPTVSLN